jgi:hypothetical protein
MLKIYLDEDVPEAIAKALQLRGYDVKTTREAGNKGFSDKKQLNYASSENRTIITFNIADFIEQHDEFVKSGVAHSGIILSKQKSIGSLTKALLKLLSTLKAKDLKNNVIWLSD